MTKEELEKEAEKNILNLKNNSIKVSGKPFQINEGDYTQGYLDGAEPREKQIQIDAEQIRALQKQNGELTDKVKELEKENLKVKQAYHKWFMRWREVKRKELEAFSRIAELEAQIEKMKEKLKADLIANLKEKMQYSTSPSCTKGMELFIRSIEKWEIKEK